MTPCVPIYGSAALLYPNAARIHGESAALPTETNTENTMNVKTNVKAGPTPIYMSINDTGVRR